MSDDQSDHERTPLSPDQAVLEESEHVLELPDDRYLVSTSRIDETQAERIQDDDESTPDESTPTRSSDRLPVDQARDALRDSLRMSDATYAVEVTAVLEGSIHAERIETDDVVAAFDAINRCFATGVGGDMSAPEVLDILVAESTLAGTRQSHGLDDVLDAFDLGPRDSIGDLIDAVEDD